MLLVQWQPKDRLHCKSQVSIPYGGVPVADLIKGDVLKLDLNANGVPALRARAIGGASIAA